MKYNSGERSADVKTIQCRKHKKHQNEGNIEKCCQPKRGFKVSAIKEQLSFAGVVNPPYPTQNEDAKWRMKMKSPSCAGL